MIPAIDSGIGLKEDRPIPKASPPGSQGFSRVLERARGHETRTEARKPLSETRPSDDPRARERYGTDTRDDAGRGADAAEARRTDAESSQTQQTDADRDAAAKAGAKPADAEGSQADEVSAEETEGELAQAAQAAGNAAIQPSRLPEEPLAEAADDPRIASEALQVVDPAQRQGTPGDSAPASALIGAAAYRMGEHSAAEQQRAEANGIVLPGSTQERMLGEGVRDARVAALQASEEAAAEAELDEAKATEKDLVKPSKVAKDEQARDLSYRDQIALQTAKNRNEVLSRLTAQGDAANATGDALRQQMQLHGLLARSARDHAVEATAPGTPATTVSGAAVPAGSVDLTQVFETPKDDAVQQRVLDRVANEARWLIRNDRQEVSLKLHPEHLGSLHMKVTHQEGQFRVDLTVDNLAAKHLLESNLQDLRNRLLGENPEGQFQFNVDVRHGNEQPSLYSRAERTMGRAVAHVDALEQSPTPGLAGRVLGQSGLSIYA